MTTTDTAGRVPPTADDVVMRLRELQVWFPIKRGVLSKTVGNVQAVDGASLDIGAAECVGLVGESGSGKTTLGRAALRLIQPTGGTIEFEGEDVTKASRERLRKLRARMQMVFQDPYASMDPRASVGSSVAEPLRAQGAGGGADLDKRVVELFDLVGMSPTYRSRYPREFSGGQLQRIAVARSLATNPSLLVLDEPVSSLDVSTKAEIINLLSDLRRDLGVSYLFIAHDLAVVGHLSRRIAVMYLGRIVEEGDAEEVYLNPQHPYTQALLSAILEARPKATRARQRIVLAGDVPSPANPPAGCRFHTRCPYVMDVCRSVDPEVAVTPAGTKVACHLHQATSESGSTVTEVHLGTEPSPGPPTDA
jgi:oligopeptide transport system ATP-binding protein